MAAVLAVSLASSPVVQAAPRKPKASQVKKAYKDLESKRFKLRIKAIDVLARSGDANAAAAITALLKDSDATVRAAACDALAKMGDAQALGELRALRSDPSPLVAERARRAALALEKRLPPSEDAPRGGAPRPEEHAGFSPGTAEPRRVPLVMGLAEDRSGSGQGGLAVLLQQGVQEALQKRRKVEISTVGSAGPAYQVKLTVQSVQQRTDGDKTLVDVMCAATVTELPVGQLRFTTRVGASSGMEGNVTDTDRDEMTQEAVRASANGLADELGRWLAKR